MEKPNQKSEGEKVAPICCDCDLNWGEYRDKESDEL